MKGLWRHFLLTLELNIRSRQAIVYGYLVPVIFLVAFGSVFRAQTPALLAQMGQLLTITILGGACFGMPTGLVAERERGIWRRYRLLPMPTGLLVGSILAARVVIVASAALLQVVLAHSLYGTPFPAHPAQAIAGVVLVTASFLGMGLVIAACANDVPAVQALGQCIFLPMIMIGGVGIPLAALPAWAQRFSGFMPGRYAVDLLQRGYDGTPGDGRFSAAALAVMGAAAALCGARLFRWEPGRRLRAGSWPLLLGALVSWLCVGTYASRSGHLDALGSGDSGYMDITEEQMAAISYENLPGDSEFVSRLSKPLGKAGSMSGLENIRGAIAEWRPGQVADPGQGARNLLCLAGVADVSEDPHEGEIARMVFDDLRQRDGDRQLERILAWVILYPDQGRCVTTVPELGLRHQFREDIVRDRAVLYAKKFLGRLRGSIRD
ncbi:MAG TPA: ABC transporter permease [Opitutaceae bacterium]|nr:ABC transporter permease [Opitutaceae bacterium]